MLDATPGPARADTAPAFIITIDTEGDNLWRRTGKPTTENARFLPRFQDLCERHGLKPTYLTAYEMATDPAFISFARAAEARKTAEVGMHLHAWDTPPLDWTLTPDDTGHHPYLIEYPIEQVRAKVATMTHRLEDAFGHRMTSHRAGRWSFNAAYAAALAELGYLVDCSVTPYVSWASHRGDPAQRGGTDFRFFPDNAYLTDPGDVSKPGAGPLLEVPMTIRPRLPLFPLSQRLVPGPVLRSRIGQSVAQRLLPNDWLRPMPGNLASMRRVLRACLVERRPYAMFMTHSSELMPGGSPYFPTAEHIERLYASLEELFSEAAEQFRGMTLTEFALEHIACAGTS